MLSWQLTCHYAFLAAIMRFENFYEPSNMACPPTVTYLGVSRSAHNRTQSMAMSGRLHNIIQNTKVLYSVGWNSSGATNSNGLLFLSAADGVL